jgi:hypothetical protein
VAVESQEGDPIDGLDEFHCSILTAMYAEKRITGCLGITDERRWVQGGKRYDPLGADYNRRTSAAQWDFKH